MRRGRLKIIIDLLRGFNNKPTVRTRCMQKSGVNNTVAFKTFPMLEDQGLIKEVQSSKRKFKTTKKGQEAIRCFDRLVELLHPLIER